MVIAAVDPNRSDLKVLVKRLRMAYSSSEVVMVSDPGLVAEYVRENPIDVLFTEAAMLGMTGFKLQEHTEAVQPAGLTVIVTATANYAMAALKSRAVEHIIKLITLANVRTALEETKYDTRSPKQMEA